MICENSVGFGRFSLKCFRVPVMEKAFEIVWYCTFLYWFNHSMKILHIIGDTALLMGSENVYVIVQKECPFFL